MYGIDLNKAREQSPWLALAGALLIVVATIGATLLWPSGSQASYGAERIEPASLQGTFQSPRRCRECHAAEFEAWSGTSHADASFEPVFQVFLQDARRPGECYACHTTGYDSVTGQFLLAGVTCEACHGPYQEGHSVGGMMIAASEELCGTCHKSTLAEWSSSRHGQSDVACTACHEVHTQNTFSADNTNRLCAGCHQSRMQDSIHNTHLDEQAGVHCVDCHLTRPSADAGAAVGGQVPTGHSFTVAIKTCDDCHPTPIQP